MNPDESSMEKPLTSKKVHVQYFALLREQRGASEETLCTDAATLQDLYDELQRVHAFSLPHQRLGVAVNNRFADWQAGFQENDTVVFIPPVAGG